MTTVKTFIGMRLRIFSLKLHLNFPLSGKNYAAAPFHCDFSSGCYIYFTPPVCMEADNAYNALLPRIQDKACSVATDCRAVGMGAKACGGYSHYEVYSTLSADENEVNQLALEYFNLSKECISQSNEISDCMDVTEPSVDCANSLCVALP